MMPLARPDTRSLFTLCVILLPALFFPATGALAQDEPAEAAAPVSGPAASSELRQAWRREFAFLTAQKRDLEQRIAEFERQSREEIAGTRANIDRLQGEVISLETRTEGAQARVREIEQQRNTAQRNADVLRATFQQASVTFSEHGHARLPEDDTGAALPDDARLRQVFAGGIALMNELAAVRREPGQFFSMSGDRIDGEIIRYGAVASYGVSGAGSGILVPAGGGELKLWRDPRPDTAQAIARGEMPPVLPLFVHGSRSAAVDTGDAEGVIEHIHSGGTIAWLIIVLALLGLGLVLARIAFLKRASTSTGAVIDDVGELVRHNRIDEAIEACRQRKGSTAAVVASALRNLDREREALDDIINESILHESTHLERFGTMILVIAAVSPLLGLLGTVTGMITTFEVITDHGTGDPQLLSGGISVALVTTELGLLVAIPLLLIGNMLSGWADRIKDDMQKAALRVINQYNHVIQQRQALKAA